MNIAVFLVGALAVTCAAVPAAAHEVQKPAEGGHTDHQYIKQPRIIEDERSINYTKQPKFDRASATYVECTKKAKTVTLGYGEYAVFESPNYPDKYPSKKTCKWQFKSEYEIYIYCVDVELEKGKKGKCKYDKLRIDSDKYCGSIEEIWHIGGTSKTVEFKSNKKKNYSGFQCYAFGNLGTETSTESTGTPTDGPTEGPTEAPPTDDPDAPCTCGQANKVSRIVGGEETEVMEYPWQAAMVYKGSTSVFCGASVIGAKHILTAAHCTQAVTDYKFDYQVLVGAHDLTDAADSQMILNPSKFIQHKDYDTTTLDNDIAIIVLSKSISFTSSAIRPVCLPTSDADEYDDVDAIVSGWGKLKENGDQPDVLMEVTVPTMTNNKCENYYSKSGITDNMLCAGYKKGKKDSCQGDSGGPLTYNSGSGYTQIGVVSWGYGCAQPKYPGVYARVTKYLSWISTNAASSNKCSAA